MFSEKVPIHHSGYNLSVGVVPSLQRSQPGSEQPKLTAERCMQQNKTSTYSRQNNKQPEGHLDITPAGFLTLTFVFWVCFFLFFLSQNTYVLKISKWPF